VRSTIQSWLVPNELARSAVVRTSGGSTAPHPVTTAPPAGSIGLGISRFSSRCHRIHARDEHTGHTTRNGGARLGRSDPPNSVARFPHHNRIVEGSRSRGSELRHPLPQPARLLARERSADPLADDHAATETGRSGLALRGPSNSEMSLWLLSATCI